MNNNEINAAWFINKYHCSPESIKVVMINEIVPEDENDDFYVPDSSYSQSIIRLFTNAGIFCDMQKLLEKGIYVCNAVKTPKEQSAIPLLQIKDSLDELEAELALFNNLEVIMLMGDAARKAFNMIVKKQTGKNVIPSGSTYKLRHNEYFYHDIRVMPSYICTGGNLLIEKSKVAMISEDIQLMMSILGDCDE